MRTAAADNGGSALVSLRAAAAARHRTYGQGGGHQERIAPARTGCCPRRQGAEGVSLVVCGFDVGDVWKVAVQVRRQH